MKTQFKKLALALAIGSTTLMAAIPASAAGVNISKLRINLSEEKPADFLTLTNSEDQKASFETTVYQWKQKDGLIKDGAIVQPESVLEESENIIISPATVVLMPKAERTIRLIAEDAEVAAEDSAYRLRLQQLNTKEGFSTGTNVNILFNISLPIFFDKETEMKAKDMKFETSIGSFDKKETDEKGKVTKVVKTEYLKVKNDNKQHIQFLGLVKGEKSFDISGYLLPGVTGYYEIPAELASDAELTVSTDKGQFTIKR